MSELVIKMTNESMDKFNPHIDWIFALVTGLLIICVIILCVLFGRLKSDAHNEQTQIDRERIQQVKQYRSLAKQKYITIKQFDKLFKSCKKTNNKRVMNNLANQKVVDSDNGFSYHAVISHFDGEGSCRKATYKLSHIQNGKTAIYAVFYF